MRQLARDGKPDDAGADHGAIDFFCHIIFSARILLEP
jgi:hypothetical protein